MATPCFHPRTGLWKDGAIEANDELVERAQELDTIQAALGRARRGMGQLVVFDGPAGIGKSSLVRAAQQAAPPDVRVFRARATELERDFPFGVALQLFERAVRDPEGARLFAGAASLAAPLFDVAADRATSRQDDHGFSLIHGLYWLSANLVEAGPALITVDDVHWSDPMSLRFLLYLAERLEGLPLAVVVTMRRGHPDAPEDLLARLTTSRSVHSSTLQPLSRGAAAGVAERAFRTDVAPEFARALYEVTAGSPLLVWEYARALADRHVAPDGAGAEVVRLTAPRSLVDRATARVTALDPPARGMLEALAVLADDPLLQELGEVAGVSGAALDHATDELVRTGLVRASSPGRIGCAHPIVRSAVYAQIPPQRRNDLHNRAGRMLLRSEAGVERAAAHFLETEPRRDPVVVEVLWPAATRASASGAPASAVRYLRRGLIEPPGADILPEYLLDLGLAELAVADPAALGHLEGALRLTPSRSRRAEILYRMGRIHRAYGRYDEAATAFEQGLEYVPDFRPQLELELESGYLSVARLRADGSGRAVRRRLADLADRLGSTMEESNVAALAEIAFDLAVSGERRDAVVEAAGPVVRTELAPLEEAGPAEIAAYTAAAALIWVDEFATGEAALSSALDAARSRASIMSVATLCYGRAVGRLARGELVGALADAQEAADAARYGWRLFLPGAYAILGTALAERGEVHRAGLALDPAHEGTADNLVLRATFLDARGRLQLVLGDPEAALGDFEQAGAFLRDVGVRNPAVAAWRSGAAVALAQLGAMHRAAQLASEELADARRVGAPRSIGVALRALGVATVTRDDKLHLLRESVETLKSSDALLERARSEVALGASLRRAGDRRLALEHLRAGLALASRCGAILLDDQARKELLAAGARPRRASVSGLGSLTPSEFRVAALASEGATNREIAQRLFVSVKAVEWHLRNAYSKLGIKSRQELLAALERPDSVGGELAS